TQTHTHTHTHRLCCSSYAGTRLHKTLTRVLVVRSLLSYTPPESVHCARHPLSSPLYSSPPLCSPLLSFPFLSSPPPFLFYPPPSLFSPLLSITPAVHPLAMPV